MSGGARLEDGQITIVPASRDEADFEQMVADAAARGAIKASQDRVRRGRRTPTPAEMAAHQVAEEIDANPWWTVSGRSWDSGIRTWDPPEPV